ncbi:homing endonuclease associated repeat-containing protein [Natronorubrum sp. FCH18a]|uniref:homing endonuclease associated repeat-containing protein n=1 Tax=Natronorubrum sp. FCH18a TaxID=3447018 RepID=UPI003F510450
MTTDEECLEALRRAAERLGESPTKAQYEELGLTPASATIIRTLDSWNEAKEAAGLETVPSRGSRVRPKPDDVELPEGTSWEELTVDQRWHYRNVEWNTQRSLNRRARHRAWVYKYKQARGCNRCEEDDPACLEFHHLDADEKEMAIGKMITHGYSKSRLESEMEKCEILCSNCHRKEHYEPPDAIEKR